MADRARHSAVLRTRASSADAGQGGALSSHTGRSAAASRQTPAAGRMAVGIARSGRAVQPGASPRGAGNATAGGTLSCQHAGVSTAAARVGVSPGQHRAAAESGRLSELGRAAVVRVRGPGGADGAPGKGRVVVVGPLSAHVRTGGGSSA